MVSSFAKISNNPRRLQEEISKREKYIRLYERGEAPDRFTSNNYRTFKEDVTQLRTLQAKFVYPDKQNVQIVEGVGGKSFLATYNENIPTQEATKTKVFTPDKTVIAENLVNRNLPRLNPQNLVNKPSITPIAQRSYVRRVSDDTIFTDSKGRGMSIAPTLAARTVREPIVGTGLKEVTYFDNRKELIQTGTTEIFGKQFATKDLGNKKTFLSSINRAYLDTETSVSDFAFPYNAGVGRRVFNPAGELDFVYKDSIKRSNERTFFDVPYVGEFFRGATDEFMERPIATTATYAAGFGLGRFVSSSPKIGKFLSNPWTKGIGLGLYGGSVTYNVATSPRPIETLGREGTRFLAFSGGIKLGLSTGKSAVAFVDAKKGLAVKRVEAFNVKSKNLDLGQNIAYNVGTDKVPKWEVLSGVSTGKGTGLYKISNKFYKVSITDTGKTFNLAEGNTKAFTGRSNLKVQRTRYVNSNLKIVGRPSKDVVLDTRGFIVNTDEGYVLSSATKINRGGVERLTNIVGKNTGQYSSNFIGQSVDTSRGKFFNKNVIAGKSDTYLQYSGKGLTGESYTYSEGGTKLLGVAKTPLNNALLKEVKGIKPVKYNNDLKPLSLFNSKKGTTIGVTSTKGSIPQTSFVNEQFVKQLINIKYVGSAQRSYSSFLKANKNLDFNVGYLPNINTKSSDNSLVSKPINIFRQGVNPVSKFRFGQDLRQNQQPKNIVTPFQDLGLNTRQTTNLRQSYRQSQKQTQETKQTTTQITRTPNIPKIVPNIIAPPAFGFALPKYRDDFNNFVGKNSFRAPKYGYSPSLDAVIFNIKGKRNKFSYSGLVTRPLEV